MNYIISDMICLKHICFKFAFLLNVILLQSWNPWVRRDLIYFRIIGVCPSVWASNIRPAGRQFMEFSRVPCCTILKQREFFVARQGKKKQERVYGRREVGQSLLYQKWLAYKQRKFMFVWVLGSKNEVL